MTAPREAAPVSVLFLTEGADSPSTRFAVTALLPLLEQNGIRCTVSHRRSEKYALPHLPCCDRRLPRLLAYALYWYPRALLGRFADLARAGAHDAVFLQRDLDENHASAWLERLLRRRARRLVFYFDDALWLGSTHLGRSLERKVREIIRMADAVAVSHAHLADYARALNPEIRLLPLSIDTDAWSPAPAREAGRGPVVVGWSGGPWNYRDLESVADALGDALRESGAELLVQSGAAPPERIRRLGARHVPWGKDREIDGLRRMDVGICPLEDTPWSRGKFSIKLLQYMAAGLPVVCSDVGANREIVVDGQTGFVARGPDQWRAHLLELIRQPRLRERMGRAARERAVEVYSSRAAAQRMADLLRALAAAAPGPARAPAPPPAQR